ncbi:MAG: hypothetical protein AUG49_12815 [Catenulispora sp. 13_1_20CM_3_70_7]|nr:hypothetical protein [Catenulisporales bacterium]OLE24667.1 MAG: hypothetical protein AUG49_12815 [Catenulispora sp. 13_1_20CM_3_70_7]
MESRDHVQPEPERARSSDESEFTLGAGEAARAEQPELYQLLRGIADDVAPGMRADFYPQVMKRATAIRRRRRALRASSLTAVLAAAVMLGPAIAHEFRARGGQTTAAPSAVVDMASAYPAAEPSAPVDVPMAAAAPAPAADSRPANALNWPARGVTPPSDAVSLATSYMEVHAKPGSTVAVTPLWAQIDDDATVVAEPRTAAEGSAARDTQKTLLFVMQAWTADADGTPSQAVLLVGDYTQSTKSTSMTVYSTPVAFAHARPGSGDDTEDTDQIAELSIWLPNTNRLVVLGAPQTTTVLYAKTGGDLIPQKTIDGVAVFPRTRTLVKGRYADTIQVRDAKNVALTPPKAWSAGDIALTGAASRWVSTAPEWVQIPALSKAPPTTQVPPATRAPAPASSSLRPTVPSGKAPTP